MVDSARRLASQAYHSKDYASQEKAALHPFQTTVGEDLQLKCAERSCRTLEMAVKTVEIQERYTKNAVRALKQEESEIALYHGEAGGPDGRDQGRSGTEKTVGRLPGNGPATEGGHGMSLVPPKRTLRKGVPDQHNRRTLGKWAVAAVTIDAGPQEGVAMEETMMVGNGLYLPGWIEGNRVSFLVDTGSGVSILAARTWKKWGCAEDELTRYWGRLCSVEGRALECLGSTRLTMTLGTRAIKWNFIVAEMGDDEGILGNNFAMAHELTVRLCKGTVYLPTLSRAKEEHMGQCLPCTICSVTEVRAITEETLAVRAVGPSTLALHTVTQVRVAVPTTRLRGTVMIEAGPGPLGLCQVRGVVKVEYDSRIWLANTGPQPIRIEENEVVAMAECVTAGPGAGPGDDQNDADEVNGLVERAAPHLTEEKCQQLQTAMAACRHLFATGK